MFAPDALDRMQFSALRQRARAGTEIDGAFVQIRYGYDNILYRIKSLELDTIMSFSLLAPEEIATDLAKRAKGRRLALDLTLEGLAKRSGVALGTLKKFERTGQISLISFIRLAVALKDDAALERLLLEPEYDSLEDVLGHKNTRKRGRIT